MWGGDIELLPPIRAPFGELGAQFGISKEVLAIDHADLVFRILRKREKTRNVRHELICLYRHI
jgi:hypothetical protein